jgi:hypothetical protein
MGWKRQGSTAALGGAVAPEKWRNNAVLIRHAEPIRTGKNKLEKTESDPLRKPPVFGEIGEP